MTTSQIQATVDAIATQQVDNEMGSQRYALLFKPGTYGSAANPLTFQVGYYTEVAGLGASPGDVTINGHVDVYNRCLTPDNCIALVNFWRSLSNLTINVMGLSGCRSSGDFWAVSQAAPMRRVNITGGNLTLMDYCTAGPQYASGGFIADSQTGFVINGSQQQFLVRDSSIGGWSNGVWNQVFSGVVGAPPQSFSTTPFDPPPYTTLADFSGHARTAVPPRRLFGTLRRVRPGAPPRLVGHDLEQRPGRRLGDSGRRVLRRQAERRRSDDQQGARAGSEPDLHARRVPRRQDDQGQEARHRRARARLPHADPRQRRHDDVGRGRQGREARGAAVRRRPGEFVDAARGRRRRRAQERRRTTRRRSTTCSSASAARPRARRPRASS